MSVLGAHDALSSNRALDVVMEAAQALHGEPDLDRAVRWSVEALAQLFEVTDVAICLVSRDESPTWHTHPDSSLPFALLGDPRTSPLLAGAFANGNVVVVEDVPTYEASQPGGPQVTALLRVGRIVVVPVHDREGHVQAGLVVAHRDPGAVAPEAIGILGTLASHLGVALDNHEVVARLAYLQARDAEVVHQLQEAVRPRAPVVAHTDLGVHYVPADPQSPTGGDLYDWLMLPDDHLHVAVVDVMGKGVEATKHAVAVVHALRVLVLSGCPLEDLVGRADRVVTAQSPELVATLIVARYDPASGRVQLAGAGHPPALLVSDTRVREIAAPGIPIGWPGAGSHAVVELTLGRADTLLLYTDGLIEATKDILEGLAGLAESARETASYPANAMSRALVERQLSDADRRDDSLALVLRRRLPARTEPVHALAPFVHRFSPNPAAVPVARHLLGDWLSRVPVDAPALDPLLLVASELCSNAVVHGAPNRTVTLRAEAKEGDIIIEVIDEGGVDVTAPLPVGDVPDPMAERGRGLFLVSELSDHVTSTVEEGKTVIRAVKQDVIPAVTQSV